MLQKSSKIDHTEARELYEKGLLEALERDIDNLEGFEKESFIKAFGKFLQNEWEFKHQKENWQNFVGKWKEFIPIAYEYQPKEYKKYQIPRKYSMEEFFNTFLSEEEAEEQEEPYSIDDEIPEYDDYD